jgi:2-oxoglutarate dehydrogenase E2 component (dihydrolipoamide succinyltransferase)
MSIEIKVPVLGESVVEATVAKWMKNVGEKVNADEPIVELETDKVSLEVPSPKAGVLTDIVAQEGDTVEVDAILALLQEGAVAAAESKQPIENKNEEKIQPQAVNLSPAVRRLVEENNLDASSIPASGKDGRLTKGDVLSFLEKEVSNVPSSSSAGSTSHISETLENKKDNLREERVPMSRLRRVIAQRLKEAQNTAAMLTTFNEVDMTAVMELRSQYKESFEKNHEARLGFMGFFVKACIAGLREFPAVNAEINGNDIIYKDYYNIGVAVGTPQGLVVPVIKDAHDLSIAEIETSVAGYGLKARDGGLAPSDMSGGTFTISNGGVYGSLMSTPILNTPQSAILGMHKIQKRPIAVGDEIVIRPMMYLALSYDHRIIDGREAVSFLVRVKESIEDPRRLLLDI